MAIEGTPQPNAIIAKATRTLPSDCLSIRSNPSPTLLRKKLSPTPIQLRIIPSVSIVSSVWNSDVCCCQISDCWIVISCQISNINRFLHHSCTIMKSLFNVQSFHFTPNCDSVSWNDQIILVSHASLKSHKTSNCFSCFVDSVVSVEYSRVEDSVFCSVRVKKKLQDLSSFQNESSFFEFVVCSYLS